MKLYDYARRQNKGLKDKQWDWVDEEFRRIWDALYNKRFQYSNQLGGSVSGDLNSQISLPRPHARDIFQCSYVQVLGQPSSNTRFTFNYGENSIGGLGTFSALEGFYGSYATTTVLGNNAFNFNSHAGEPVSQPYSTRFNPQFEACIRTHTTPSQITGVRYYVGFVDFQDAIGGSANFPPANVNDMLIGFKFDPAIALDKRWVPVIRSSHGGGILFPTETGGSEGMGPIVDTDTQYIFSIYIFRTGNNLCDIIFRIESLKLAPSLLSFDTTDDIGQVVGVTYPEDHTLAMELDVETQTAGVAKTLRFMYLYCQARKGTPISF